jgi:hypothetical protein
MLCKAPYTVGRNPQLTCCKGEDRDHRPVESLTATVTKDSKERSLEDSAGHLRDVNLRVLHMRMLT